MKTPKANIKCYHCEGNNTIKNGSGTRSLRGKYNCKNLMCGCNTFYYSPGKEVGKEGMYHIPNIKGRMFTYEEARQQYEADNSFFTNPNLKAMMIAKPKVVAETIIRIKNMMKTEVKNLKSNRKELTEKTKIEEIDAKIKKMEVKLKKHDEGEKFFR